jgi:hypothetical protein
MYNLVVWVTNLGPTGSGRLTKQVSDMIKLPPYIYSAIIGLLLSDGWLIRASVTNKNYRLSQSLAHFEYGWFVYTILSHYCSSYPAYRLRKRFGKINYSIEFFTRSLLCFTELQPIFYINKVKAIPVDIYNLLTPVALSHLVMVDGSVSRHGLILCTNSYTIQDVVRLMNVLIIRYKLECSIH